MDAEKSEQLFKQVNILRDSFYEDNKKNIIFKSEQKNKLADKVCDTFDLQQMIRYTTYIIPYSNKIYFTYPLFKTYGNTDNCDNLCKYMKHVLISSILESNETFELHINLKGFTVSACQRFFSAIKSLIDGNKVLTEKMTQMCIYFTPGVIDQIKNLLYAVVQHILPKVTFYNTSESDSAIDILHNFETK
jgi:hypothetical protein